MLGRMDARLAPQVAKPMKGFMTVSKNTFISLLIAATLFSLSDCILAVDHNNNELSERTPLVRENQNRDNTPPHNSELHKRHNKTKDQESEIKKPRTYKVLKFMGCIALRCISSNGL